METTGAAFRYGSRGVRTATPGRRAASTTNEEVAAGREALEHAVPVPPCQACLVGPAVALVGAFPGAPHRESGDLDRPARARLLATAAQGGLDVAVAEHEAPPHVERVLDLELLVQRPKGD